MILRIITSKNLILLAVFLCCLLIVSPAPKAEPKSKPGIPVDLELVLAVDASFSVDSSEFELQMRGLALAFRDPDVIEAILSTGANGIAVALVQWAGDEQQVLSLGWTRIHDKTSALRFANRIATATRDIDGATAISGAMTFAADLIGTNGFSGRRKIIDVSGDGPSNHGVDTALVRNYLVARGITINGLPILNEWQTLDQYYRKNVIGGPGSFLITARDYHDFTRAIRLKLIREIAVRLASLKN